jgi:hypothetical protein
MNVQIRFCTLKTEAGGSLETSLRVYHVIIPGKKYTGYATVQSAPRTFNAKYADILWQLLRNATKPCNPRFTRDAPGSYRYHGESRQLTHRSAGAVLGTRSTCALSQVERHY